MAARSAEYPHGLPSLLEESAKKTANSISFWMPWMRQDGATFL